MWVHKALLPEGGVPDLARLFSLGSVWTLGDAKADGWEGPGCLQMQSWGVHRVLRARRGPEAGSSVLQREGLRDQEPETLLVVLEGTYQVPSGAR